MLQSKQYQSLAKMAAPAQGVTTYDDNGHGGNSGANADADDEAEDDGDGDVDGDGIGGSNGDGDSDGDGGSSVHADGLMVVAMVSLLVMVVIMQ